MCHAETGKGVQTAFMFMSLKFYMSLNVRVLRLFREFIIIVLIIIIIRSED